MKKKMLAMALAAVLAVSGISPAVEVKAVETQESVSETIDEGEVFFSSNDSFETAGELTLDQDCNVSPDGHEAWYKFVPQEDGIYVFSSKGSGDTFGKLYGSDMSWLDENDDSEEDYNFQITYYLRASTTYYLCANTYDDEEFTIHVEKGEVPEELTIFYNTRILTKNYNESLTLNVGAVGGEGAINYQWYAGGIGEENKIDGAVDSSYKVGAGDTEDYYICTVTDGTDTKSAYFTLSIDTGLKAASDIGEKDEYGNNDRIVSVDYAGTLELSVTASSETGNLSYQWYKDFTDDYRVKIEGATESSLTEPGSSVSEGTYACWIEDGINRRIFTFDIMLETGLEVSSDCGVAGNSGRGDRIKERIITVPYGENMTLEVTASGGAGDISCQWYHAAKPSKSVIIEGATESSYTLADAVTEKEDDYYCEVTDGITKRAIWFSVKVDTGLEVSSDSGEFYEEGGDGRKVIVAYGEETLLQVTARSNIGEVSYQWYGEGYWNDDEEAKIEGATGSSYTVTGGEDTGSVYVCEVTDGIKSEEIYFYITVDTGFTVSSETGTEYTEGYRYVTAKKGDPVTFEVNAESKLGEISYQWYASSWDDEDAELTGAAGSSYTIAQAAETGSYCCKVTNGNDTEYIYFDVLVDIGLDWDWQNKTVTVSGTGSVPSNVGKYISFQTGIEKIVVAEGITELGNGAFSGCGCVNSIELPDGLSVIGDNALAATAIKSIEIPAGVTSIGESAFLSCTDLETISIPASVTSIGKWAAGYCYDETVFNYVKAENLPTIYCYEDSAAYSYAVENDIPYELVKEEAVSVDIRTCTVTLSAASMPYTGTAIKPQVSVTDGSNTLKEGTDYEVSYKDNVNAGTAAVTITGKGNYTGTVTKTFTITAKKIDEKMAVLSQISYEYSGVAIKPQVSVTDGSNTLKEGTDYQVSYKDNVNAGTAAVTITGKGNYTGTVTKTFTINAKNISKAAVTLSKTSCDYNGKAQKPQVTAVKLENKTLTSNDYTVGYKNNTNIGKATVTITGKGNYTGAVSKTFTINAKKGSSFTVGTYKYKISSSSAVAFAGLKNSKTKKVTIPKTVEIGGKTFKVTSVANNALKKTNVTSVTVGDNVTTIGNSAFEGCAKLTKVTVGTGAAKIGASAFKNCKKLGTITIKSTKLKTVGKNALKGIKATAKIKVPAKKLDAYKNLFKGKGQGKKVKIVK